jgi:hypothetical protein
MRLIHMAAPLLLVSAAASTFAQTPPARSPSDIVVVGGRDKPSEWREAETSHVVIISDGRESELIRLTRNIERLHFLLSGLLGRSDTPDDPIKLRITLIGDVADFEQMDLRNKRWQQGPFNDLFGLARFYDPRADGAVLASTRVDQKTVIERTTATPQRIQGVLSAMAQGQGSSAGAGQPQGGDAGAVAQAQSAIVGDFATAGMLGEHDYQPGTGARTIEVTAESLLYAGYAQHYLLSHFPAAYPRWYLDGFGQIFGSFATKGDNIIEFGRAPTGAGAVLDEFGGFPIADVLNDHYLAEKPSNTRWTPIHAWLLTHYLFFSDDRRPQLRRYLSLRAAGTDAATAAQVFGDPQKLGRELRAYFGVRKPYDQITYDGSAIEDPIVHRLSQGEAAFVRGRLELGGRILPPPAVAPRADVQAIAKLRDHAIRERDRWLDQLRADAARWKSEPQAQLLLAEAECRSDHADRCLVAADAAHALMPSDARALAWRGDALARLAAVAPLAERAGKLADARKAIIVANRADPEAVEPLIAYYESFARTGAAAPDSAIDGLQKTVMEVPNSPESRLRLATGLANHKQPDAARQVILPVAKGPYDSPERPAALALLDRLGAGVTATP